MVRCAPHQEVTKRLANELLDWGERNAVIEVTNDKVKKELKKGLRELVGANRQPGLRGQPQAPQRTFRPQNRPAGSR